MYGTIVRYQVQPGKFDQLSAWAEAARSGGPDRGGLMIVFQMDRDPNELFAVFAAESRAAYRAINDDPASHERYLQMKEFLAAEPEWNDGEILVSAFDLPDSRNPYGTISRQRIKPGKFDEVFAWNEANQPEDISPGTMLVFQMDRDPNEVFLVIVAPSEADYRAASEDPAMHERYLEMMQFMAAEPEWNDGHVIMHDVRV